MKNLIKCMKTKEAIEKIGTSANSVIIKGWLISDHPYIIKEVR